MGHYHHHVTVWLGSIIDFCRKNTSPGCLSFFFALNKLSFALLTEEAISPFATVKANESGNDLRNWQEKQPSSQVIDVWRNALNRLVLIEVSSLFTPNIGQGCQLVFVTVQSDKVNPVAVVVDQRIVTKGLDSWPKLGYWRRTQHCWPIFHFKSVVTILYTNQLLLTIVWFLDQDFLLQFLTRDLWLCSISFLAIPFSENCPVNVKSSMFCQVQWASSSRCIHSHR